MPKLVSVVGATGIQGGSVMQALLNDHAYTVRAITRNKDSAAAEALRMQGAEVVEADLDDFSSLRSAFAGSYAIFAVTNFFDSFTTVGPSRAIENESTQGINLAKAASATVTLQHYIWSTLPNADRISRGKALVPHFVAKNRVDSYIKSDSALFSKTTFLWVSFYASNLQYPFYSPICVPTAGSNKYIQLLATPSSVQLTLIGDARTNVGLFVRAILDQPQRTLPGRFVLGSTDTMTAGELLSLWASIHGKEAEYVQVDKRTYYNMWPMWAEAMDAAHMYWHLVKEKSYSGDDEDVILTGQDLGVVGLVDTATAIARMEDWRN
ncbi:Fc.00g082660.m01.CDS01 [Cosmosporella sp. VM-42]